jgi:hypothetical protein
MARKVAVGLLSAHIIHTRPLGSCVPPFESFPK